MVEKLRTEQAMGIPDFAFPTSDAQLNRVEIEIA